MIDDVISVFYTLLFFAACFMIASVALFLFDLIKEFIKK